MQNRVPTQRPALDFEPVPRKYRFDGWTAERQRAFIAALAETGSVKAAAKRINMSYEGAYYLRRQPGADGFRAAWIAALDHGVQRLADIAVERAMEGVPVPIHWRGEQVGEKRWYNDRLLMFVLRHHLADRYGGAGLAGGTRSRETIEREAQENCPVCKARAAEAAEAARAAGSEAEQRRKDDAWLEGLLKRYVAKVAYERRKRLEGDVVAADFTVRQLTHIELMFELAGAPQKCVAQWTGEGPDSEDIFATDHCRLLERARQLVWAKGDGALRPYVRLPDRPLRNGFFGQTPAERVAAQREANRQMAAAQALWEAAATEEAWEKWCGEGCGTGLS